MKWNTKKNSFVLVISILLTCTSFYAFAGKLYKWVDEDGNVHYGDAIPPENIVNKHSTISDKGIKLESIDKAKSEEERRLTQEKAAEEKRLAEEKARLNRIQRAYDQRLLQTYTSESELIRMRDRQVSTIEGSITLTRSNINKLEIQLEKYSNEAKNADPESKAGKKVLTSLDETRKQINEYKQFITNRRNEQEKIKSQFNRDLKRLRQLLSAN